MGIWEPRHLWVLPRVISSLRTRRARLLVEQGRFEEADRFIDRWVAKRRSNLAMARQHALSAHNSGRYALAAERWHQLRSRWPSEPMGWSGEAANLREMGRLHDARVLIDAAMLRFPEDPIAVTEAIRIVDRLDDGEAGLSLRQRMIQLQLDEPRWWTGYLEMLLHLSRIDEAEAELPAALLRHPCDPRLGLMTTLFALRRHQWDRATSLLETHAFASDAPLVDAAKAAANERLVHCPEESRFLFSCLQRQQPADASVAHGLVDSLLRCGRYVEAGARLEEALISFPEDCHLKFAAALHALKVERWDAAIDDFIDLIARRPDYPGASQHLGLARMEKAFRSNHDAAFHADPQRQDVGLVEDDATRRLLLGFESLGQDCELGLVQRRFGAEPLGLFRWNFVEPELLCDALASGFDGLGAEANTEMALWKDDEYYLRDRRWGFAFHTWVTRHEVDGDEHFSKMRRRLAYLKDKFLADLASAEKVFVLKTYDTSADVVRELHARLRSYGPVQLLWLRSLAMLPTAPDVRRDVIEIEDGLFTGYLGRFGNTPSSTWDIDFDDWTRLCRRVRIAIDGKCIGERAAP